MKIKNLNGAWESPLDVRGKHFIRPLGEAKHYVTTPPTPDEEEGPVKLHWRPCPKCKGQPDDGQFRMICLNYGEKACRQCVKELREATLRVAHESRDLDSLATDFLRRGSKGQGFRMNRKGYLIEQTKKEPWEK